MTGDLLPNFGTAVVCRFAPSPNGLLHLGHAYSALWSHTIARRTHGRFLVRIEDIDTERCRENYVTALIEDLDWLGIEYEQPVLRQSAHFERYGAAAERLNALGVVYPCFASRTEIGSATPPYAPRDPDGLALYPGRGRVISDDETQRRSARGAPFALRLDMARARAVAAAKLADAPLHFTEWGELRSARTVAADPAVWGDVVIVRKDTPASYHLAVVVDDAYQDISLVTRGYDLYPATGLHRLLQILLDLPKPDYAHHRLVTKKDGRKLAKSARDGSLRELRNQGVTAAEVTRMLTQVDASDQLQACRC